MSDGIQSKIRNTFQVDEEEVLEQKLEEVSDWFGLDQDMIDLSPKILELSKKWKYLTYVVAAKFAYYGDLREEENVLHEEANDYFGWDRDDGETAKGHSRHISKYLTKTEGGSGRKIPPAKLDKAINHIKEELGEDE